MAVDKGLTRLVSETELIAFRRTGLTRLEADPFIASMLHTPLTVIITSLTNSLCELLGETSCEETLVIADCCTTFYFYSTVRRKIDACLICILSIHVWPF